MIYMRIDQDFEITCTSTLILDLSFEWMNEWNSTDDLVLSLKKMSNMILLLFFTFHNKRIID